MSEEIELGAFEVGGPECREIFDRLVRECDEFAHILEGEPAVVFLLRRDPKIKQGRDVLGECCLPTVQGALRSMFEWLMLQQFGHRPDFLVVLDKDYWDSCGDHLREVLMHHEAMHMGHALDKDGAPRYDKDTGRPVWCIQGHSVEEFTETVRRYGAWNAGLREFVESVSGK